MKRRYLLTTDAEADLSDIKNYLQKEAGVSVARYVLREIKSAFVFQQALDIFART